MSSNVVSFPPKAAKTAEGVWVCGCGCTTHYHHIDGNVECGSCGNIASGANGDWRERVPDPSGGLAPMKPENFKIADLENAENWLRRNIKAASQIRTIVIIDKDGSISTWADEQDGDAFRRWIKPKMASAIKRLTAFKSP